MMENDKAIEALTDIRSMMERSSKFISLSGLTGVFAGIFALAGAAAAYFYSAKSFGPDFIFDNLQAGQKTAVLTFYSVDALLVLALSVGIGILLSARKSRKTGQSVLDKTAVRMLVNLAVPLLTGGIFCIALLWHGIIGLIAPAMLIFYGLSLINASKYTIGDTRYLGYLEVVLGLISCFFIGYGLLFWAVGFGFFHIAYGLFMYYTLEK
jgi:predicted lysophospholipase L1 biosynthesis ABC-type transport system permease subunit